MALEDILTLPLKVAQELLSQPARPAASAAAYADEVDKAEFERDIPNFFRQAAQQIAEAERVRQAQEEEFAARQAAASASAPVEEDAEVLAPLAGYDQTSGQSMLRGPQFEPTQPGPIDVPMSPAPGAPIGPGYNPLLEETITPAIESTQVGSKVGDALGWLKKNVADPVLDKAGDVVEGVGAGVQRLPDWVPGDERVGTAIESLPMAAGRFVEGFGKGFEEQHGVPLSPETAKSALFAEFRNEVNLVSMWSDRILTDYTIDPVLHATLPDFLADPAVKAVGFAAQILPWAVIGIVGGVPAGIAMTATFATLAAEDTINLLGAYQRGQIDGKTLALGVGLNSIDLADPWTGHILGRATAGFRNKAAIQAAIRDIEAITGNKLDTPQLNRGINAAEELQKNAPSYEQLAEEKFGPGASLTREERMARTAEGLGPDVAPIPEQVRDLTPAPDLTQRVTDAVQDAPVSVLIDEQPQSPLDVRLDRHRLTTAEGDRLDYRGTHINDVTVQVERQGRGSALLNRAIEDIRSRDPGATITADLNSEGGARLFARLNGAVFTDAQGNPLTPETAIAAAARREGPLVELPPASVAADAPAPKVEEPVAVSAGRVDDPNVEKPVDATDAKAGDDGWTKKTYDKVERRRVEKNQYGEVWERRDGKFDMVDSRWASMEGGQTAGAGSDNIRTFDSIDDARASLEELTARFSKPPEARAADFRAAAGRAIEDADAVKEAEREATKPNIVREAEDVAAKAQPELTPAEEVKDLTGNRKRPILEATESARAEQTYGPMVKDTMGENGGATYNPRTGKPVPYKDFFVGGYAPSKTVKADNFGPQDLADYVRENFDVFKDKSISIGTERVSRDGVDYINIDAVRNVATKGQAIRIGKVNGEQRVWDANNDVAVEVPGVKQIEKSVNPTEKFFDGESGAIDYARIGAVAKDWIRSASVAIKRVLAAVARAGRTFHNNELGQIRLGRGKFEGISDTDFLDFGASRRWLFPEESWDSWADQMVTRIGGTRELWNSRRGDIRIHAEKMMGLMGEGQQGVIGKGDNARRFGQESGPATFERMKTLYDEGSVLHQNGKSIDMRRWYDKFWPTMKEHFGDDAEMFTMMMAMTQANNSPANGVSIAMRSYVQWKLGDPIHRMGSRTVRNEIEGFLMGHVPEGPKINPFWEALRFIGARGRNAVAVDRWVIGAMGAKSMGPGMDVKSLQGNKAFIRFSQNLIKTAADEAGVTPRAFQAAIWGGFRREWDGLLKAAGGRPMGGDNDFFENLMLRTFKEFSLRSPSDFRLNSSEVTQRQLFGDLAADTVEEWQQLRAREVSHFLSTTQKNTDAILKTIQMNEWNTKIAAAYMLDTGEVPAHLTKPEVVDEVLRVAQHHKRAFTDRVQMADDKTLRDLKVIPEWQKRVVDAELDQRKRLGESYSPAWTALPKDEQKRLQTLGWMRVPDSPKDVARTQVLLDELDGITTEQGLIRWMNKKGVQNIVGDKQAFIGKMTETGESYTNSDGEATMKTEASPYWEPRSFYENRLVLNVEKVKTELRRRFPIDPNQKRGLADTIKLKQVGENLGECGLKVAG